MIQGSKKHGNIFAPHLLVPALGHVGVVPGVGARARLPLELPVLDLDVAARRTVGRVVQRAHLGADLLQVRRGAHANLHPVHGDWNGK